MTSLYANKWLISNRFIHDRNTWNYLTVCKNWARACLKMLSTNHRCFIYKDLALNNLQGLICHENQPNQTNNPLSLSLGSFSFSSLFLLLLPTLSWSFPSHFLLAFSLILPLPSSKHVSCNRNDMIFHQVFWVYFLVVILLWHIRVQRETRLLKPCDNGIL